MVPSSAIVRSQCRYIQRFLVTIALFSSHPINTSCDASTRQRLRVSSRTPLRSSPALPYSDTTSDSLRDAARRCHLPNNQIVKDPTERSQPKPVSDRLLTRSFTSPSRAKTRDQLITNSFKPLGVNQSGKGRIYSSSQPSSTPPTKNSLLIQTDWELGFRRESHPQVMRRAVIPSYALNYRDSEIAGKGSLANSVSRFLYP